MKAAKMKWSALLTCVAVGALTIAMPARGHKSDQTTDAKSSAAAASNDPILKAMHEELERSKAKLKMDDVPAPYYIEYRLSDAEEFDAQAAFGSAITNRIVTSAAAWAP